MLTKLLISILVLSVFFGSNIYVSASILDDYKNGFKQNSDKLKIKTKVVEDQLQTEVDEIKNESKQICEIQKNYAIKHFEDRQLKRGKDIEVKLVSINKIKVLLSNNKQDINNINLIIDALVRQLKQKLELLDTRIQVTNTIDCTKEKETYNIIKNLKETNQNLNKIDKEISDQTREFSGEVQRLVIKMKETKPENNNN